MLKLFNFALLFLMFLFVNCEYISPDKLSPNCRNFCKKIECETIKECEDGIVEETGSYCGCCPSCVKYLDNFESCSEILTGPLALIPQSKCKSGSKCINGTCLPDTVGTSECLQHKSLRENLKGTDLYKEDIWIPQCNFDGKYAAKQKKIRKSVCVDEAGKTIFGRIDDFSETKCACSRYMLEKEKSDGFHSKPQEHCSPSGNFAPLQCIEDLCYCADKYTGQVKSYLVARKFLNKLPCYNEDSQQKNYQTNCEMELQRYRKLIYDFQLKGMRVIGIDRIKCDPDGTYSPTQCTSTNCVCTDKEGVGIKSYHPDSQESQLVDMECDCAREEKYHQNSMFRCTKYGNYDFLTCVKDHCICVDEDGDIISEQAKDYLNKEICEELRYNLKTNSDY